MTDTTTDAWPGMPDTLKLACTYSTDGVHPYVRGDGEGIEYVKAEALRTQQHETEKSLVECGETIASLTAENEALTTKLEQYQKAAPFPPCMAPDGAEPCVQYRVQKEVADNQTWHVRELKSQLSTQTLRITKLEAKIAEFIHDENQGESWPPEQSR